MTKINKYWIGGLAIAFVMLLGISYSAIAEVSIWDLIIDRTSDKLAEEVGEFVVGDESLAGFPTADFQTDYLCVHGVCTYYINGNFNTGTSTLFSFKNPWGATSTITFQSYDWTMGASTSQKYLIATSTTKGLTLAGQSNGDFGTFYTASSTKESAFCQGLTCAVSGVPNDTGDGGSFPSATSLVIAPQEYLTMYATSTQEFSLCPAVNFIGATTTADSQVVGQNGCTDGVTNPDSVLRGTYRIEIQKL